MASIRCEERGQREVRVKLRVGFWMDKGKRLCYNGGMITNLAMFSGGLVGDDLGWGAIIAFLVGFVVAQLCKFAMQLCRGRKKPVGQNLKEALPYLTNSGGMPSGHSAAMTGVTVFLGCYYGFTSGIFALAVAITGIVLYDATHARYAVGEQGQALNKLLKESGEAELPIVKGHTIGQVIVGVTLGIIVGLGVYFLIQ